MFLALLTLRSAFSKPDFADFSAAVKSPEIGLGEFGLNLLRYFLSRSSGLSGNTSQTFGNKSLQQSEYRFSHPNFHN